MIDPSLKSIDVEDYVPLYRQLVKDVEALTGLDMKRDEMTLSARAENEGMKFLSSRLPAFAKHVLLCIEHGMFTPVAGFQKRRKGPLPRFLGGLVSMLFAEDGTLHDKDPVMEADALRYIQQICFYLYKMEVPMTEEGKAKDLSAFRTRNRESRVHRVYPNDGSIGDLVLCNAIDFCQELFRGFVMRGVPKHGPGAVEDHSVRYGKYEFRYDPKLCKTFPYHIYFGSVSLDPVDRLVHDQLEFFKPGTCDIVDYLHTEVDDESGLWLTRVEPFPPPKPSKAKYCHTARLACVPKDSRGNRVITVESKERQWLQQWMRTSLVEHMSNAPLTRGHINFDDQTVNGELARRSSLDGDFATLDLKDASDRVTTQLVSLILPGTITRRLFAMRSEFVTSGCKHEKPEKLGMFAGMGNACCFPVLSAVVYALAVSAIATKVGSFVRAIPHVYVYGDDVIVRSKYAQLVMDAYAAVGLVVNTAKSYCRGPFRESCGVEAYRGEEVTPLRLKKSLPSDWADTGSVITCVENANAMYARGYRNTARYLQHVVEEKIGPLPYVPKHSSLLGWHTKSNVYALTKRERFFYATDVQQWQVEGTVLRRPSKKDEPSLRVHMLRAICKRRDRSPSWVDVVYPEDKGPMHSFPGILGLIYRSQVESVEGNLVTKRECG